MPPGLVGLPILCVVLVVVWSALDDEPLDGGLVLITVAVATGLGLVLAAAVLPSSMKRVRVDPAGLHVRDRLALPADRIGQVQALRGLDAASQSWPLSRKRGVELPAKQNLYGGLYGFGPAVGIEEIDRRGVRRSTWLIPSKQPHQLATALEHARDHAAGS